MKKLIIILGVMVSGILYINAQQNPQYTQFMSNPFYMNPAIAGTNNYYQVRFANRFQWIRLNRPPITNVLSAYGPTEKYPMGIGGYIVNDIIGPESKTSLMGSYAYNYPINDMYNISMGLHLGIMQYRLDGTKVRFYEEEPILDDKVINKILPDATFGAYFYSSELYVGLSVTQLFNMKVKYDKGYSTREHDYGRLKSHIFLMGGYKYIINKEYAVEPSILIKEVFPLGPQFDINVKGYYKKIAWAGLAWRTSDAISIMIGYIHQNTIHIGYAYDIGVSRFRHAHHGGAHELVVSYKFDPIK